MARFTNPSTWGRSKPKASAAELSTADLNQSSSYRDPYAQPSSYGAAGGSASGSGSHHHPYASNPSSAPPVIAHDVTDSDETCPVCLESLAFSFRLPGEKPHVVPECGHALHEVSNPLPKLTAAIVSDGARGGRPFLPGCGIELEGSRTRARTRVPVRIAIGDFCIATSALSASVRHVIRSVLISFSTRSGMLHHGIRPATNSQERWRSSEEEQHRRLRRLSTPNEGRRWRWRKIK